MQAYVAHSIDDVAASPTAGGGVRRGHLLAALIAILALDGLLLLPFLGVGLLPVTAFAVLTIPIV